MSKSPKVIPYSDILIDKNGGTVIIDLSLDEKKRIINKINKHQFEKDYQKIEYQIKQVSQKLETSDESFSFEDFTLYEQKISIKNLIKTLSIIKINDFDYTLSNQYNLNNYQKIKNNIKIEEHLLRNWIYYSSQYQTSLSQLFNSDGHLKKNYQLHEFITNLYNLWFTREQTNKNNSFQDLVISIIEGINLKTKIIIQKISKRYTRFSFTIYFILTPIIIILILKMFKQYRPTLFKISSKIKKYFNSDEIQGLNSRSKKLLLTSSIFYLNYNNLHNIIGSILYQKVNYKLGDILFMKNFSYYHKKDIIDFHQNLCSLDLLVQKFCCKNIDDLIDILDNIPPFKIQEVNLFTSNILEILKKQIRNKKNLNLSCNKLVQTLIKEDKNLPIYFFIDRHCFERTSLECICCFIICLLKVNNIQIFSNHSITL